MLCGHAATVAVAGVALAQQRLNLMPEPHGHWELRPGPGGTRIGCCAELCRISGFSAASAIGSSAFTGTEGRLTSSGVRRGGGRHFEDCQGGAQADGRRGFFVIQDFAQDLECPALERFGLFTEEEGTLVDGLFEQGREGWDLAAPVGYGVPVHSGGASSFRDGDAVEKVIEDFVLGFGELFGGLHVCSEWGFPISE
jgi:hypothetical protein